jgi:hypothetical protein
MTENLLDPIRMVCMAMRETNTNEADTQSAKPIEHRLSIIGRINQQRFTLIMQNVSLNAVPVDGTRHHVHPGWRALRNRLPLIDSDLLERPSAQAQSLGQCSHLGPVSRLIATFQRRNVAAGQPRHSGNVADRQPLSGACFFQDVAKVVF